MKVKYRDVYRIEPTGKKRGGVPQWTSCEVAVLLREGGWEVLAANVPSSRQGDEIVKIHRRLCGWKGAA